MFETPVLVRRPPPDPGEGYRLLEYGERMTSGDEYFNRQGVWIRWQLWEIPAELCSVHESTPYTRRLKTHWKGWKMRLCCRLPDDYFKGIAA